MAPGSVSTNRHKHRASFHKHPSADWSFTRGATRQWALLYPAHLIVSVIITYIAYLALMVLQSPSWDSIDYIGGQSRVLCVIIVIVIAIADRAPIRCKGDSSNGNSGP
jgi:hypothetical protein